MSMEDPFFVVKGEVQNELQAAEMLHHRWRKLEQAAEGASKEDMHWTINELSNCLRSIEWDLEDLEETVSIVLSNPKKFNLDETELKNRKIFIVNTRLSVQAMKEQMTGPIAASTDRQNRRQALQENWAFKGPIWQPGLQDQRLVHQRENTNSQFLNEQHAQQQLMAEQQDEQFQLMSGTIAVLKNMSERIGLELDEQATMLDDLSHEVGNTQSRLDNMMKKLAKVSHMTSDRHQWCAIWVLLAVLFIVLLLFFIL